MKTTFKLLDCSLHRKLKPVQNLSLLIFIIFLIIFLNMKHLGVLSTSRTFLKTLFAVLILSLVVFCVLGLFFLYKKVIGFLDIQDEYLEVDDVKYNFNEVKLDLNTYSLKNLKHLPFWGNYFVINDKKYEFLPNKGLEKIYDNFEKIDTKRNILTYSTKEVFYNIGSLLWASS